jgi:hypothetical protein
MYDECELCGGPVMLLGQLGGRVHLTCQDCGAALRSLEIGSQGRMRA